MVEQPSETLRRQLEEFSRAVSGLEKIVLYDFSGRNLIEQDIYKNACIQKFEYCAELGWKLVKRFLEEVNGQIIASPKPVYRYFFSNLLVDEELAVALFQTINDRNLLSHVYKESIFDEAFERVPAHLVAFKRLVAVLDKLITE